MKSLIVTKNVQKKRFEGDWGKKLFRKTITRKIYGRNSSFYVQKERETETERDYCISNSENYLTITVRKKIFTVGGWKKRHTLESRIFVPFWFKRFISQH